MKNEFNNGPISCSDFFVEGNTIWLFHEEINALISFNIEEKRTEYITSMDEEKSLDHFLFIRVLKFNEYIILVPCFAEHLYIYNVKDKNVVFKYDVKKIYDKPYVFCDAYIVDKQIICFPHEVNKPILTVDISNPDNCVLTYFDADNKGYFSKCCMHEDIVYAVNPEANAVVSVNVHNGDTIRHSIPEVAGLEAISKDEDYLYLLTSKKRKLLKYDIHKQEIVDELDVPCDIVEIKCFDNKRIWADTIDQFAYLIELKTKTILKYDKLKFGKVLASIEYKNGAVHSQDNTLYYFNKQRSCFLRIDEYTEVEIPIRLSADEKKRMLKNILLKEEPISESNFFDLSDFIERI